MITLGGKRIYFAGVTECVPEVRALKNIDVAFMPMNIPLERMTPSAAAECVKAIAPKIVYVYHYDQLARGAAHESARELGAAGRRAEIARACRRSRTRCTGTSIEVRDARWYP